MLERETEESLFFFDLERKDFRIFPLLGEVSNESTFANLFLNSVFVVDLLIAGKNIARPRARRFSGN